VQTGDLLAPTAADASVRPASSGDVPAIGAVQARSWRAAYATLLPEGAIEVLASPDALAIWQAAVTSPPSRRHAVLVACSGAAVVGFAALAPSPDPDAGDDDGELAALAVDPAHQRAGHGSRLLAACADVLREKGFRAVHVWVPAEDDVMRGFLTSAGLITDGARRGYRGAGGREVIELRLSADLADPSGQA
jgi:ribosomal protein S18 acetylase RimI-like enzyme